MKGGAFRERFFLADNKTQKEMVHLDVVTSIVVPPSPQFHFPLSQSPTVNRSLKILNGKFQNKQLMSFKWSDILSSVIKSHTILHHPAREVNYPFVQRIHAINAT